MMNDKNYASLEASKRLFSSGIVLKTEASWDWNGREYVLSPAGTLLPGFPAPSMAEAWRELPDEEASHVRKVFNGKTIISKHKGSRVIEEIVYINPTDALIDLLIWVRKQEER